MSRLPSNVVLLLAAVATVALFAHAPGVQVAAQAVRGSTTASAADVICAAPDLKTLCQIIDAAGNAKTAADLSVSGIDIRYRAPSVLILGSRRSTLSCPFRHYRVQHGTPLLVCSCGLRDRVWRLTSAAGLCGAACASHACVRYAKHRSAV